jgi:very-short-patch-repair endonuclease
LVLLAGSTLNGYKFVREHVIGVYIVDFICRAKKLIVEVDGGQHAEAIEYDQKRTQYLESEGYRVLRIWNNEVFANIEGVLEPVQSLLSK